MAQVFIEKYDYLPCKLRTFTVNGIELEDDEDIFGDVLTDLQPGEWGNYCIVEFIPHSLEEVKNRINKRCPELEHLTPAEIENIQKKLASVFNIGECGWCCP